MDIIFELQKLGCAKYADFQTKLTPTIKKETCIGVRVPILRKFAKTINKTPTSEKFLNTLPHAYYDENMLHAILISLEKDFQKAIICLDAFLPYVDNWAVCDICSPKILAKNKTELLKKIKDWTKSNHTYTIRFGIEMLMSFFLDKDFKAEYLEIPKRIISNEYYVNMMIAWFFATALAKKWDDTFKVIQNNELPIWVHNKTIQKAVESYRISNEQKEILKGLKR